MATPTRSQNVSTPKNLMSTPSKHMASPRPGTAAVSQRPFAYKSPAVKTPASVHSHAHHMSVSSQPSSTPLAAAAIHDELLALNSPAAALINSINPSGLTPLTSGQDGLGITTQLQETPNQDGPAGRSQEAEKLQRLQQVADSLKSRITGRGISREGVEKIAKLYGFTPMWDESNLTIAGHRVDLEVLFDIVDADKVKDVKLNLNLSDGDEFKPQQQASEVLKRDLGVSEGDFPPGTWKNLDSFAVNLQRLSLLDHKDESINCFMMIDNLYETFKKIWDEEKKRLSWRDELHHERHGNVGKPFRDHKSRLGLSTEYWTSRREMSATATENAAGITSKQSAYELPYGAWTAQFGVAPGNPFITSSQDWLSADVLDKEPKADNVLDSDVELLKPHWRDTGASNIGDGGNNKEDPEDMLVEKSNGIPRTLNMSFICDLDPFVLLPVNVAAGLNVEIEMVQIHQTQAVTYQQALQNHRNAKAGLGTEQLIDTRWRRFIPVFDKTGKHIYKSHSYALYSSMDRAELWCVPVKQMKFNHPRHFSTALATLRQYAMLWTLLASLIESPTKERESVAAEQKSAKPEVTRRNNNSNKRSIVKADALSTLEDILGQHASDADRTALAVDLSLDVVSDPSKPRLEIFTPIQSTTPNDVHAAFFHVSIVVDAGGSIEVIDASGIPSANLANFRVKFARVLNLSEDLGTGIEWALTQIQD